MALSLAQFSHADPGTFSLREFCSNVNLDDCPVDWHWFAQTLRLFKRCWLYVGAWTLVYHALIFLCRQHRHWFGLLSINFWLNNSISSPVCVERHEHSYVQCHASMRANRQFDAWRVIPTFTSFKRHRDECVDDHVGNICRRWVHSSLLMMLMTKTFQLLAILTLTRMHTHLASSRSFQTLPTSPRCRRREWRRTLALFLLPI